jgi:predicted unusual protein kinase regulating ubiquinone biosynthesis (AarF/ABC1/UbiB family)
MAVERLSNLRGLAAKVGQMASYIDGFLPADQSEPYARALASLQTATVSSPFAAIRALLEQELQGPLSQHFAQFEERPIASASIGQVHRAVLHGGREVAVKVQHAGIREAIESDLKSAGVIASLASSLGPTGIDPETAFNEVAARFREELDYTLEASRQSSFRALFAHDARVHIPAIVTSHSTGRVMTSEFCRGLSFEDATRESPTLRKSYAETLWRFVFTSVLIHGTFNADPHPGNYLFHQDGRVTFLDFGCMQVLSESYRENLRLMHLAALDADAARFNAAARAAFKTVPGDYEGALIDYVFRCYEPLKSSPYHLQRAYVAEVVRSTQDLKRHMFKKRSKPTPIPNGMVLLNRLQFGFFSVLARLDVAADYAGVHRQILDEQARAESLSQSLPVGAPG